MNDANTPESMRLFFALWPDDATRGALQQLQMPIQGRLVSYGNLHLTLAFLGQQPTALLPALKDLLTRLPSSAAALHLDRIGYFTRKRIAWAGMHAVPDALIALQQDVQQAVRRVIPEFNERQEFKPHVTLARDASLPPDLSFTPIVWQARQVALVRSESTMHGEEPAYRVLATRAIEEEYWTPNQAGDRANDLRGLP